MSNLAPQSRAPQTLAVASGAGFPSNAVMEVRYLVQHILQAHGYACDTGGGLGSADVWAKKEGHPEIYINLRERTLGDQAPLGSLGRAGS